MVVQREQEIESSIRKEITPSSYWTVNREQINENIFIIIDVPAGRDNPYTFQGKIYLRENSRTVEGSEKKIQMLVQKGYTESERWERQQIPGAGVERLRNKLIFDTARIGVEKRSFIFSNEKDPKGILKELGLLRHDNITNAAEILFGIHPSIQFPQIRSRVTVYAASKGGDFIDNKVFEGPAFEMLKEIMDMIKKHTPIASIFRGGLRRTDQVVYPEEAVREGLVNAFAHRDYAEFSGSISVDLYPDKLVIWNYGSLPPGVTVQDLKREHPSIPRNPDIVQVLWLREYMERVGRGTQNIVLWCKQAGLAMPTWKSDESGVSLTLRYAQKSNLGNFNQRQNKMLEDLKVGDSIRLPDYQKKYMVSERQGRRDLKELVEAGYLNREGDGPSTIFIRLDK